MAGSAEGAHDFVEAGLTLAVSAGLTGLMRGIDDFNAKLAAARAQGARNAFARRDATAEVGRDVASLLRQDLAEADRDCLVIQRQIDDVSDDLGLRVIARRPAVRVYTADVGTLRAQVAAANSELLALTEELDDLLS